MKTIKRLQSNDMSKIYIWGNASDSYAYIYVCMVMSRFRSDNGVAMSIIKFFLRMECGYSCLVVLNCICPFLCNFVSGKLSHGVY